MSFEFLVQPDIDAPRAAEVPVVRALATQLDRAIRHATITTSLAAIPAIGGNSHAVDAILAPTARELGFQSQRKDLFAAYPRASAPTGTARSAPPPAASSSRSSAARPSPTTWTSSICGSATSAAKRTTSSSLSPSASPAAPGARPSSPASPSAWPPSSTPPTVNVASIAVFGY
ncbi:MAG TPA: hypothetical protein VFP84_18320 [Kofleriaceae bacterium]|nr:hypothetical protein [Kofleriaceae bacterium]